MKSFKKMKLSPKGFDKEIYNAVYDLANTSEFKVTISLAQSYTNPTLKFDGTTITPNSSGKYVISDVIAGNHTVTVECATYKNYSSTINCSPSNNSFTVTLEPNIINVTATVTKDGVAVEGASVSATGVTAVTTGADGKAVLSKQADSIAGVTATKTIDDTVYSATSDSTFTEDSNVTLALEAEEE